jgi:hypothetical protein
MPNASTDDRQGRSASEVAANEAALYRFVIYASDVVMLLCALYGGWQVGGWLLRELGGLL